MKHTDRAVLIIGASSGIGFHAASHLHQLGYTVNGTSRNPAAVLAANGQAYPFPLVQMDVDDDISVKNCIEEIVQRNGRLDIVVNSAGYGLAGSVEDTSIDEAKRQFETNFFGILRVCRAVLPIMRGQRYGYIVNVGSIGGVVGIPFQSIYSASKFALEGLSEALRMEVEPYGIRVVLVQPGNYRTEFTASRIAASDSNHQSVYRDTFERALAVMVNDELNAPEPVAVARVIERAIRADSPRLRYVVDPTMARYMPMLKRLLPYPIIEAAMNRVFKLNGKPASLGPRPHGDDDGQQ